jgi:hypothetical protein
MAAELMALGALVSAANADHAPPQERLALEQGMRASLLCTWLGLEREGWVWPYRQGDTRMSARLLGGLLEPLEGIGLLATLAGAADLDPMDPGPSHTVLPATLAACVVGGSDSDLASGVLAGVEAAWRLRRSVTGARPGIGFHSPGVYGTVAAAAAGARTLRLDARESAHAMAIALTRAAGLAVNSAASMIGMTHFGWGAAHGLESALLAAEGWDASLDLDKALGTLSGAGQVDVSTIEQPGAAGAVAGLVFKRYPCNIYLNALVALLEQIPDRPVDRIEIRMPWIPHLDCASPRDIRQARNSAQAVAAIAGAGAVSYAAFSGPRGPWLPESAVAALLPRVTLIADRSAPTRLSEAVVGVRAWRGSQQVLEASRATRELGGWGVEHARVLLGAQSPPAEVDALYGGTISQAYGHVRMRRLAMLAGRLDTNTGESDGR